MVFLPEDSIINSSKLTHYLLVQLPKDDKSKFLAQAGYTLENWQQLEQDLRTQVLTQCCPNHIFLTIGGGFDGFSRLSEDLGS